RGRTPAAARRRERGRGRQARRAEGSGGVGWAALGVVVVAIVAGLYFFRVEVVTYWPPAQAAYDLAKLDTSPPVTAPGADLRILSNPTVDFRDDDGTLVIDIEGEVQNVSRLTRSVPQIMQVILLNEGNEVLTEWKFRSPVSILGPLDKFSYRTSIIDAPRETRRLQVTFVTQSDG
ncbi:MAG: hypothetical protein O3C65_04970, partial [Proteobacteria bacterium]|nr:hypothetical protein [Pseudomonadota bacterium]